MMSFSQLPAPAPEPVCRECGAPYAPGRRWCVACGEELP